MFNGRVITRFLLSMLGVCFFSVSVFGGTIYVNGQDGYASWDGTAASYQSGTVGPKATIQGGINAAVGGDAVEVAEGTYTGAGNVNIDFLGKAITVYSDTGRDNCIIDCQYILGNRGVIFNNGEGPDSVLRGFTIMRGKLLGMPIIGTHAKGGGIYCSGASPTIESCIIRDHVVEGVDRNNSGSGAPAYGGGIYCDSGSNAIITKCTISNNRAEGGYGNTGPDPWDPPGPGWDGGSVYGGGIYGSSDSHLTISDCIISQNEAIRGRYGSGDPDGDDGDGYGGGIYGKVTIKNSTIIDNRVAGGGGGVGQEERGGGLYCFDGSSITALKIAGGYSAVLPPLRTPQLLITLLTLEV